MTLVKDVITAAGQPSMNLTEIMKRIAKGPHSSLKLRKEDLTDAIDYYKKLSVIYMDSDENVLFI
jgi:hypothetical protein